MASPFSVATAVLPERYGVEGGSAVATLATPPVLSQADVAAAAGLLEGLRSYTTPRKLARTLETLLTAIEKYKPPVTSAGEDGQAAGAGSTAPPPPLPLPLVVLRARAVLRELGALLIACRLPTRFSPADFAATREDADFYVVSLSAAGSQQALGGITLPAFNVDAALAEASSGAAGGGRHTAPPAFPAGASVPKAAATVIACQVLSVLHGLVLAPGLALEARRALGQELAVLRALIFYGCAAADDTVCEVSLSLLGHLMPQAGPPALPGLDPSGFAYGQSLATTLCELDVPSNAWNTGRAAALQWIGTAAAAGRELYAATVRAIPGLYKRVILHPGVSHTALVTALVGLGSWANAANASSSAVTAAYTAAVVQARAVGAQQLPPAPRLLQGLAEALLAPSSPSDGAAAAAAPAPGECELLALLRDAMLDVPHSALALALAQPDGSGGGGSGEGAAAEVTTSAPLDPQAAEEARQRERLQAASRWTQYVCAVPGTLEARAAASVYSLFDPISDLPRGVGSRVPWEQSVLEIPQLLEREVAVRAQLDREEGGRAGRGSGSSGSGEGEGDGSAASDSARSSSSSSSSSSGPAAVAAVHDAAAASSSGSAASGAAAATSSSSSAPSSVAASAANAAQLAPWRLITPSQCLSDRALKQLALERRDAAVYALEAVAHLGFDPFQRAALAVPGLLERLLAAVETTIGAGDTPETAARALAWLCRCPAAHAALQPLQPALARLQASLGPENPRLVNTIRNAISYAVQFSRGGGGGAAV